VAPTQTKTSTPIPATATSTRTSQTEGEGVGPVAPELPNTGGGATSGNDAHILLVFLIAGAACGAAAVAYGLKRRMNR
jgi:hypothetical protein